MTQNRSGAVMAQRVEPDDSLDDFPTPSWATRAMVEHVLRPANLPLGRVWEPACNRGFMVRPLWGYFDNVYASDVFDYSPQYQRGAVIFDKHGGACSDEGQQSVCDFLFPGAEPQVIRANPVDWIITNPPFRLAEQFVRRALSLARVGVAVIVRTAFLEGGERYEKLYRDMAPTLIAQPAERVIMTKGICRDPSKKYWDAEEGKWKRPSTATAYCWLVWVHGMERQPFQWIPPCRKQFERPGDYSPVEESARALTE